MHAAYLKPRSSNAHILWIQNHQCFVPLSLVWIGQKSQSRNFNIIQKNHDFAIGFIPAPSVSNTVIMATSRLFYFWWAGRGFACFSPKGAGYGANLDDIFVTLRTIRHACYSVYCTLAVVDSVYKQTDRRLEFFSVNRWVLNKFF